MSLNTDSVTANNPGTGFPDDWHLLRESEWQKRAARHRNRLEPIVLPHLKRRAVGEKQPLIDFLFEYYKFRPSRLLRWSPGMAVIMEGSSAESYLPFKDFSPCDFGVGLLPERFPEKRLSAVRWIRDLLQATLDRPAAYGCLGIHEWAMVYEEQDIRHDQLPLRLPHQEIRSVVEQGPVCCSHFDAFRFFSKSAHSFNQLVPDENSRLEMEQPGCLHANMDLYKWAYKLYPWICSDLLADAFLLALDIRTLDMQASPYDVRLLGHEPVFIEKPEGKVEYVTRQKEFSQKAQLLRKELIVAIDKLLARVEP